MLSNFVSKEPVDQCKRFDRKEKKHIEVERPVAIAIYNKCMAVRGQDEYASFTVPFNNTYQRMVS